MSNIIIINNISLPYKAESREALARAAELLRPYKAVEVEIYKRSTDARKKDNILFVYSVRVRLECDAASLPAGFMQRIGASEFDESIVNLKSGAETLSNRPLVVGFGPCGMFSALLLAEYGYRPIVIERGGDVGERVQSVENFYKSGNLDIESNIQFGAGGAGTFSDGKLTTRINDPRCRYILQKFYEMGAPKEVLINAKPHIGTDKLICVVQNIRERIREMGGEIYFNTRLDSVNTSGGKIVSAVTSAGEIQCGALLLAVGHSARDTYAMLRSSGFLLENKPFSVGVRIEHLRSDIDFAMYGKAAGDPLLGAADYNFSLRRGGQAVYTFCMCPGGEVVGAASEDGGVVVNGMSRYMRDGRNSNCALAVSAAPENPIEFQRALELAAYDAAGGNYRAPVQTVGGFFDGMRDTSFGRVTPTYMGDSGRTSMCDMNKILPREICDMLKLGISDFDRKLHGFAARDSLLCGVETRTSAPLRILRSENMTAVGYDNIYPCGEGAGYAGGIMSAAADGVRCAEKIIERYSNFH